MISSERPLPTAYREFCYSRTGGAPEDVHHVLAFCDGFIGEIATMASECAVLGVPAIYMANTGRGYTDEQERRYNLVKNVRALNWEALQPALRWLCALQPDECEAARRRLLADCIDVSQFVVDTLENFR